jgi:uncharacterized protein YlaI
MVHGGFRRKSQNAASDFEFQKKLFECILCVRLAFSSKATNIIVRLRNNNNLRVFCCFSSTQHCDYAASSQPRSFVFSAPPSSSLDDLERQCRS